MKITITQMYRIAQNLCYSEFWVQVYLVWTGLISTGVNDSNFVSFFEY